MQTIENKQDSDTIVVFSEISHSDHLSKWCSEYNVKSLSAN